MLRTWFARPGAEAPGWYRAMGDPVVGRALRLLQDAPAHPWTVAGLAAGTGVSRAGLARRFTELVGEPPMAYLTGWRFAVAADRSPPCGRLEPSRRWGTRWPRRPGGQPLPHRPGRSPPSGPPRSRRNRWRRSDSPDINRPEQYERLLALPAMTAWTAARQQEHAADAATYDAALAAPQSGLRSQHVAGDGRWSALLRARKVEKHLRTMAKAASSAGAGSGGPAHHVRRTRRRPPRAARGSGRPRSCARAMAARPSPP